MTRPPCRAQGRRSHRSPHFPTLLPCDASDSICPVGDKYHSSFFSAVGPGSSGVGEKVAALFLRLPGVKSVVDVVAR